jgi:hypothetical protein
MKASHDRWVEKNKEYLAKQRHEYYMENREDVLRKDKEYRENNYDEYMKRVKRYRSENKEAIRGRARKKMEEFHEYSPWANLNTRCNNPLATGYENYGGRGIKVCERWQGKGGFRNFLDDMGRRPTPSHSIERLDVNGNYELSYPLVGQNIFLRLAGKSARKSRVQICQQEVYLFYATAN